MGTFAAPNLSGSRNNTLASTHFDRLNLDRTARPGAFLLARIALHQRAKVPAAVGQPCRHDARPRDHEAANHGSALVELPGAVAEADGVDLDDAACRRAKG